MVPCADPIDGSDQGDPTKAPDITNNSWECPASEGCSFDTLQAAVESQAAAGIMMVVGSRKLAAELLNCARSPGLYEATYTAGALNTGTDTIASLAAAAQSQPMEATASNLTSLLLGTNTRSCDNACDSCYTTASGTSMATPHIAGAMALLWSAIPGLQNQIHASRTR